MELTVKCPDCGKTLKVTVTTENEPQTEIIRKISTPTTWGEIATLIRAGKARKFLSIGDAVPFTMKDGQTVKAIVTEINPYNENEVAFVIEDCLTKNHIMNEKRTNTGGWRYSDMRKYLNKDVFNLLPNELKAVIADREIKQIENGEELISTDKLWLLSLAEIAEDGYKVDKDDVHFSLFKDERSRVKQQDGKTAWYWLRSPNTSTTSFRVITGSGNAISSSVSNLNGVAFGFLIR